MPETTARPFTAAVFNQYLCEHRLMLARCDQCGRCYLPPRAICSQCHSNHLTWLAASGDGSLSAYTVIYGGPNFMVEQGFDRNHPYVSGVVTLPEGVAISARITGVDPLIPEAIQIGTLLTVDFIDVGQGESRRSYLAFKAL